MKNSYIAIIIVIVVVVIAAGAYVATLPPSAPTPPKPTPTVTPTTTPTPTPAQKLKVAAVLDTFIKEDMWNEIFYNGLQRAKQKYGDRIEIAYSEKVSLADYERVGRDYANAGNDLIFLHATPVGEAAKSIARDFPKKWIVWSEGWPPIEKNMVCFVAESYEAGYLAGILAGRMTKVNKIGCVGGMNVPSTYRIYNAFAEAVKSVNPQAEVKVTWVGTFVDIGKGYDSAVAEMDWGADVICGLGDSQNVGARTAVMARNLTRPVWYIGGTGDEYPYAPSVTLASIGSGYDIGVFDIIGKALDGKLEPAKIYSYNLKAGAELFWGRVNVIPANVKAEVDGLRQKIIDGTFTVPRKDAP